MAKWRDVLTPGEGAWRDMVKAESGCRKAGCTLNWEYSIDMLRFECWHNRREYLAMEHDGPKQLVADTVIHWIKKLHDEEDEVLANFLSDANWVD